MGYFGSRPNSSVDIQQTITFLLEVLFLNRLYVNSVCTTKSSLSRCVAVFRRICRLPSGPNAVHGEILAGHEADKEAEAIK